VPKYHAGLQTTIPIVDITNAQSQQYQLYPQIERKISFANSLCVDSSMQTGKFQYELLLQKQQILMLKTWSLH